MAPTSGWRLLLAPAAFVVGGLGLLVLRPAALPAPGVLLLLAVAVIAAFLALPAAVRLPVQLAVAALTGVLVTAAGLSLVDTAWSLIALLAVIVVIDRFAAVLSALRAEDAEERVRLERRLEVLAAVEELPDDRDAAIRATVRALRDLRFDAAAVSFVRGGLFHAELLDGIEDPGPVSVELGLAGRALRTDATVVSPDYASEPDRLEGVGGNHAVVVAPIRVDGSPVGVVLADRRALGRPTAMEVETVELLAAQLGGVLTALAREGRQSELLERARH
ncbi:MAG: GAF domain-containing protein, partial [Nitriliruptoraceae bacterium]